MVLFPLTIAQGAGVLEFTGEGAVTLPGLTSAFGGWVGPRGEAHAFLNLPLSAVAGLISITGQGAGVLPLVWSLPSFRGSLVGSFPLCGAGATNTSSGTRGTQGKLYIGLGI